MKTFKIILTTALIAMAVPAVAQHAGHGGVPKGAVAPAWTQYPMVLPGGGYSRSGAKYQAFNMHAMEASSIAAFDNDAPAALETATQDLRVSDSGSLSVKAGQKGGYYLVQVVGHGPGGEEALATTVKYFSNPGPAPRDMLNASRSGFEIVPAILPREHSRYRENETWPFRVQMNGQPVADARVMLETSNGTKTEFVTDAQGVAQVLFPGDFPDIPKEQWSHGRPPASQFVLGVRNGGLLATFNSDYRLGAYGNKNLWAGVGFAVLGMIGAAPLVRRRKTS